MNRIALDELKQRIPLLQYLQAHDWQQARPIGFGRLLGLCPLHADHKPSFLVDPHKNLFYCYGCRRGGDVIRFAELYHQVKFPQAVALLHQWRGLPPLLHEAAGFYRMQLHRHAEAVAYLYQRGVRAPELIVNTEVAKRLYELRISARLSQRELAKKVGTTASVICRLEDADYEGHSLSLLRRIAAAVGKRVEIRFVAIPKRPEVPDGPAPSRRKVARGKERRARRRALPRGVRRTARARAQRKARRGKAALQG